MNTKQVLKELTKLYQWVFNTSSMCPDIEFWSLDSYIKNRQKLIKQNKDGIQVLDEIRDIFRPKDYGYSDVERGAIAEECIKRAAALLCEHQAFIGYEPEIIGRLFLSPGCSCGAIDWSIVRDERWDEPTNKVVESVEHLVQAGIIYVGNEDRLYLTKKFFEDIGLPEGYGK